MGYVRVAARIGPTPGDLHDVEFTVDTGAFYTILSPELCDEIGLDTPLEERVMTADSRPHTIHVGIAHVEVDGRSAGILIGRMESPTPLLGVSALEALGFKVSPVDGKLEPTRPFPEIPLL